MGWQMDADRLQIFQSKKYFCCFEREGKILYNWPKNVTMRQRQSVDTGYHSLCLCLSSVPILPFLIQSQLFEGFVTQST